MSEDFQKLKNELQTLNSNYIRLSGQLEQLNKQEQEEIAKLRQIGVVDLDAEISKLSTEVGSIKDSVDYSLRELEAASK